MELTDDLAEFAYKRIKFVKICRSQDVFLQKEHSRIGVVAKNMTHCIDKVLCDNYFNYFLTAS